MGIPLKLKVKIKKPPKGFRSKKQNLSHSPKEIKMLKTLTSSEEAKELTR